MSVYGRPSLAAQWAPLPSGALFFRPLATLVARLAAHSTPAAALPAPISLHRPPARRRLASQPASQPTSSPSSSPARRLARSPAGLAVINHALQVLHLPGASRRRRWSLLAELLGSAEGGQTLCKTGRLAPLPRAQPEGALPAPRAPDWHWRLRDCSGGKFRPPERTRGGPSAPFIQHSSAGPISRRPLQHTYIYIRRREVSGARQAARNERQEELTPIRLSPAKLWTLLGGLASGNLSKTVFLFSSSPGRQGGGCSFTRRPSSAQTASKQRPDSARTAQAPEHSLTAAQWPVASPLGSPRVQWTRVRPTSELNVCILAAGSGGFPFPKTDLTFSTSPFWLLVGFGAAASLSLWSSLQRATQVPRLLARLPQRVEPAETLCGWRSCQSRGGSCFSWETSTREARARV